MITIYGEEIDGIEICDHINVKSCTYDFDAISEWVEYYITLNKALTTYQTSIASVTLNHGFIKLLEKKWVTFTRTKEAKWFDNLQHQVYTNIYSVVIKLKFPNQYVLAVPAMRKKKSFF